MKRNPERLRYIVCYENTQQGKRWYVRDTKLELYVDGGTQSEAEATRQASRLNLEDQSVQTQNTTRLSASSETPKDVTRFPLIAARVKGSKRTCTPIVIHDQEELDANAILAATLEEGLIIMPVPSELLPTQSAVSADPQECKQDADCVVSKQSGCCLRCGVSHDGDPCRECGARAYHKPECAALADPQQSKSWTPFQVFGRNAITFPDSGIEADCLIITEHINGEDQEIAAVYGPTPTEGPEMGPDVERYANLLASAPELLDVLERLMAVCRPRAYETPTPDWKWRLDLAEAAITKAKGGGQ